MEYYILKPGAKVNLQEKIIFDKKNVLSKKENRNGPVVHLFYHEMKDKSPVIKRTFDWIFGVILYMVHIISKPFIIVLFKLSGVKKVHAEYNACGQHGILIKTRIYNIGLRQAENNYTSKLKQINRVQKFFLRTGLFKLPQLTGVFKNNYSLVGPELLEESFAEKMLTSYSECHKRFAPKPGIFSPVTYFVPSDNEMKNKEKLTEDLAYAARQTFTNYLRILFFRNLVIR